MSDNNKKENASRNLSNSMSTISIFVGSISVLMSVAFLSWTLYVFSVDMGKMELFAIIPLIIGIFLLVSTVIFSVTAIITGILAIGKSTKRKLPAISIVLGVGGMVMVATCTTVIALFGGI